MMMDRRQALKSISLAFGSTIATSTLLNILASCSEEKKTSQYLFLNDKQSFITNHILDFILPAQDFPNRVPIDFVKFTDEMIYHTVSKKEQQLFNKGSEEFTQTFMSLYNKNVLQGVKQDFEPLLKKYFSISKENEENIFDLLQHDFSSITSHSKSDYLNYTFLTKVRYYCLFGYCTSEAYSYL